MDVSFSGTGGSVNPVFPLRSASPPGGLPGGYYTLEFVQPLDAPVPACEFVISIPAAQTVLLDRLRWVPLPPTAP